MIHMSIQSIISKYIDTVTGNIKCNGRNNPIQSKKELYQIFSIWITYNKEERGKRLVENNFNQQPCLYVQIDGSTFFINSDTRIEGVREFFKNKDNDWCVIVNREGVVRNKVTNLISKKDISHFYMYKDL